MSRLKPSLPFNMIFFNLLCFLMPLLCFSQQTDSSISGRFLPVGSRVKMTTSQQKQITGTVQAVQSNVLIIASKERKDTLNLSDIQRIWYRARSGEKGALVGAAIGGASGAVYGAIVGLVGASEGTSVSSPAALGAVGGLIGAAVGVLSGYTIGATIPHWELYYNIADTPYTLPKFPVPKVARSRIGFAAGFAGVGVDNGYAGKNLFFGDRFQWSAYLKKCLLLSGEFGFSRNNRTNINYLGAVALYSLPNRCIPFYALAGLGVYSWRKGLTSLTASTGLVAAYPLSQKLRALIEIRWHQNLQRLANVNPSFLTLMMGIGTSW